MSWLGLYCASLFDLYHISVTPPSFNLIIGMGCYFLFYSLPCLALSPNILSLSIPASIFHFIG